MSMIQSLEQQVNEMKIAEIDVHDQVMHAISARKNRRNTIQPKLLIAVVISLVFIVGTGFASVKFINLYNDKREQWVSILPMNEEEARLSAETRGISDYYLTLIEEGEAIAVYNPNNNDDQVVSVRPKPVQHNEWNQLIIDVGDRFPLPKSLSEQYDFQFATINRAAIEPNTEKLIEESKANGNKVTYEKLKLEEDIHSLTMVLMIGGNDYTISMYEGKSWGTVYTTEFNKEGSQPFKVGGIDGYITSDEFQTFAMWRSSESMGDVFYQIYTNNTSHQANDEIKTLLNELVALQ